jgi:hypothetical protein
MKGHERENKMLSLLHYRYAIYSGGQKSTYPFDCNPTRPAISGMVDADDGIKL